MNQRSPIGFVFLAIGCVLIVLAAAITRLETSVWWSVLLGFLGMLSLGGFAEQLSEHPVSRGWWAFVGLGAVLLAFSGTYLWAFKEPDPVGLVTGALGAIALSGGLALQSPRVVHGVGARTAGSWLFSLVLVVLALFIAAAAVAVTDGPLAHQFDLTRDRRFTISDQTVKILEGIQDDIAVHAFFDPQSKEKTKFDDLLAGMKNHTSHLVVESINPLEDPLKTYEFAVTNNNTVVLQQGDRKQRIESNFTEENIANAIVKLQSGSDHAICWAVGRGEADPDDDQSPDGLGLIVQKMEGANYQVTKKINVLTDGIPADCEAIVVANPRGDWGPTELASLADYIAGGGKALVLLEPIDGETGKVAAPNLAADLARYGIEVDNDIVLETDPRALTSPRATDLLFREDNYAAGSPITRNLKAYTAFTTVRSMHAKKDAKGVTTEEVIKTAPSAWGEVFTTGEFTGDIQREQGVDKDGPLPIMVTSTIDDPAVIAAPVGPVQEDTDADPFGTVKDPAKPAATAQKKGGRIVVVGDVDFLAPSETGVAFGSNPDVFLNSIAWLVNEEAQLGERPKPPDTLELSLVEQIVIAIGTEILLPLLCLALAAIVLVRRRYF